jgi:membrane fusion protein (multidrug efflux system)
MASDQEEGRDEEPGQDTPDRRRAKDNQSDNSSSGKDRKNSSGDGDGDDDKKPSLFAKPWVRIALIVVVLLVVAGGVIWWLIARHYEDTDDAFIDTHIIHVAPQIAGQVLTIHVNDNQFVRAGQLLVEIDARNQTAQLEQTEAQRLQAFSQIEQAQAQERAAQAQVTNASRDLARYHTLKAATPQAVAQQQLDQAEATARNAIAQRDQAAAQISGAQAQIKVLDAQIATAKLQLSYAQVVAPVDGHVTQRSVALGNYVSPGQEMMAIVPSQLWVTANFKETQLALMRRGQHVTVSLDSCNQEIGGHIDSIQRGAGQAFGILPPENATGNFVKVVQRVPVKILLDHVPPGCVLGPGMSVEPTVTVR